MSVHTPTDAATLVMDSAEGFESLLEAAGTAAVARWENAWTTGSNPPTSEAAPAQPLAAFDNRPTWDNPTATFDNRPSWDNWKNK
ncbi:multiple cyclophane-containing RiPP AmcA [Streptomyces erythrochromogenes]|uniref:multiple cyclophane-containing RiPP AmcA n=1 Tax=Streptomyces erythrochromogenes TaxID=285574 RepID=UPI0036C2CE81